MSLERGHSWNWGDHQFIGYSIAGITTSLYYKNQKIVFDLGQGLPFQMGARAIYLTHLHADHAAGLPYLLSQKSLFRLPEIPVLFPKTYKNDLETILQVWEKIEEVKYPYRLHGMTNQELLTIDDKTRLRALKSTHRIDSLSYLLENKRKRLRADLQGESSETLRNLRLKGVALEEEFWEPVFAFSGDTQIELLDDHPQLYQTPLLFLECTYLDERKAVSETRRWGHIHLDEIIERAERFKNQTLCLIHLSARYGREEALRILEQRLPLPLRDRVVVFPR